MAHEVTMPRLSDSMEEGTILAWNKRVGDAVAVGDELAEIETDKANMTYESDFEGTLLALLVDEGQACHVGAPIARIGEPGEEAASQEPSAKVQASPLARRLAKELGVDLAALAASAGEGRITKADVERAAASASPAPAAAKTETAKGATEVVELSRLQRVAATRMSESKATAPHFYMRCEVDMSAAARTRDGLRDLVGEAPVSSFNDLVIKACALALRDHPRVNGAYRDGRVELYERINVGVAVAAEDGLLVPVVHDADRKGLAEIAAATRTLAGRARDGSITAPEMSGGTFSISNLGMFGVTSFEAVLNPPEAAILAVGAIEDRPVVRDGRLAAAPLMSMTLSGDHRILNGVDGARFLARVRALLEQPLGLAL